MFDMTSFPPDEQLLFPLGAYDATQIKALADYATYLMAEYTGHYPELVDVISDYAQREQINSTMRTGMKPWEYGRTPESMEQVVSRAEIGLAVGLEALTYPVLKVFLDREPWTTIDLIATYVKVGDTARYNGTSLPVSLLLSLIVEHVRVGYSERREKELKALVMSLPVPEGMRKGLLDAARTNLPSYALDRPVTH